MSGRTLYPRINDTRGQWLDRLIHGTRWTTRTEWGVCMYNQHVYSKEIPVATNDATASNMALLSAFGGTDHCPECSSPIFWLGGREKLDEFLAGEAQKQGK